VTRVAQRKRGPEQPVGVIGEPLGFEQAALRRPALRASRTCLAGDPSHSLSVPTAPACDTTAVDG
jgi:hypothetical protein